MVTTENPRHVQHVLKDNFENYEKGAEFRERMRDVLGDGIFNADGAQWYWQRKTASRMFSDNSFRLNMFDVFVKHANTMVAVLLDQGSGSASRERSSCSNQVQVTTKNMSFAFQKYTLESIGEVGFGQEIGCLFVDEEHMRTASPFLYAFDEAQKITFNRTVDPTWKLKRLLGVGMERCMPELVKQLREYSSEICVDRMKELEIFKTPTKTTCSSSKADFLSLFMKEKPDLSLETYIDLTLNFLIAGRDTTANLLMWTLCELLRHPREMEKVRAEIDAEFTKHGDTIFAKIENVERGFPYLMQVLQETLRLRPSVPVDLKEPLRSDVLPGAASNVVSAEDAAEIPIPGAGRCWLLYSIYAIQRSRERWGEDADEWRPGRWATLRTQQGGGDGENNPGVSEDLPPSDAGRGAGAGERPTSHLIQNRPPTEYEFPVFNAGKRRCLGIRMAYLEAKVCLAVLLRELEFELDDTRREPAPDRSLVLGMNPPLFCKIRQRQLPL